MSKSALTREQTDLEELKRDYMLLEKVYQVTMRQATEVREELAEFMAAQGTDSMERYEIDQFAIARGDDTPKMLLDAIKFFETHAGCPFLASCPSVNGCNGIWVNMGTPCPSILGQIKKHFR